MTEGQTKRQAAKALTTSRISDAAKPLFEAKGYDAVTIRDVAKASGYSTGAVFNCYVDKADLWTRVMGRPVPDPQTFVHTVARLELASPESYDDSREALASLIEWARRMYGYPIVAVR
jgi:AcrR family transcriptional regulator